MSGRFMLLPISLFMIFLLLFCNPQRPSQAAAPKPQGPNRTDLGREIAVTFTDGSTMNVRILDEKLELITKYGPLQIPAADIERVEFATRISDADEQATRQAVEALGHPEHARRLKAMSELKALGAKGKTAIDRAAQSEDPEVAQRAEELITFLKSRYSEKQLTIKENDVVHTSDSMIAGRFKATSFRIMTYQFGELRLKLSDVQSMGDLPGDEELLLSNAEQAPAHMGAYANQFGKTLIFKLTAGQAINGNIWGTNQYTLDSSVAVAAVHAGVLKPGETKIVRVRIIQSPQIFVPSVRNGIQSHPFGVYIGGAYEFVENKNRK